MRSIENALADTFKALKIQVDVNLVKQDAHLWLLQIKPLHALLEIEIKETRGTPLVSVLHRENIGFRSFTKFMNTFTGYL